MVISPAEAADILNQTRQNQWKWIKIKRFIQEDYPGLTERYAALEKHHSDETGRMVDVIQGLCETIYPP
jgi:hypothetical protein